MKNLPVQVGTCFSFYSIVFPGSRSTKSNKDDFIVAGEMNKTCFVLI